MLTKKEIKIIEREYGFFPHKRLGQNFLIDSNVKDKLLKLVDIEKEDTLLEVGSGLGQLTFDLARRAKKVIAIEYDRKLFSILSTFADDYGNVTPIHEDFLKFDLKKICSKNRKLKVISNPPYYISTHVILKLFTCAAYINYALLTLQKEFGDRLVARRSSKDYSSLTLFAEFHAEIRRCFNISRNSFYPVPDVDSTVILLKMREEPPVQVKNRDELFGLIRAGFSKRRKTLCNALLSRGYMEASKEKLTQILKAAGIPNNARAESLSLADFARIANLL